MPNLTSSGRILRPSNGPIQVPAGRCFLVLTPNSVPGTLDLQKLTSGGSDLTALLSCRALWVNIAWCKPCKGQGTEYSILQSRQPEKKRVFFYLTRVYVFSARFTIRSKKKQLISFDSVSGGWVSLADKEGRMKCLLLRKSEKIGSLGYLRWILTTIAQKKFTSFKRTARIESLRFWVTWATRLQASTDSVIVFQVRGFLRKSTWDNGVWMYKKTHVRKPIELI